ncbi:MAG: hypothetical protein Pars2KO_30580 [Parasphingorhabdus sp.]
MTGYSSKTLKNAKQLRRNLTPQERTLWTKLQNRQLGGAKFRKQQPIGPYIVDFVCQEHKLIIEADGSQHADNPKDAQRDKWLQDRDYTVLRFWNNDIRENLDGVLFTILDAFDQNPSPTSPKQ